MAPIIFLNPDLPARSTEVGQILSEQGYSQNHPNVMWLEVGEKLGIETARKIQEHLSLKPFQAGGQCVVILEAERLTDEAQNALLKTFEELPDQSLVIMALTSEDQLLPTLVSRSQLIKSESKVASSEELDKYQNTINELLKGSMVERFQIIEKIDDTSLFLEAMVKFFRQLLIQNPTKQNQNFIRELMEAQKWAKQNANTRAILEYLMFKLP